ncbi:MAG: DUF1611 domain-containing protein [Bacteroidetes bacterium]|nr:DUF1611 domain-containing protein [Bacteroidota bacterium]
MLQPHHKVAIYMEGHLESDFGKMGFGAVRYLQNEIVAVIDSSQSGREMSDFVATSRQIPVVGSLDAAIDRGAEVLLLGIAPVGGKIPDFWYATLDAAVEKGLSLINGLHDVLAPRYETKLTGAANWVWDVRVPQFTPPIGSARALTHKGIRLLCVGTDNAVGKMTAGLELYNALLQNKHSVGFVATGQIGITVTGKGIPLDAFKVDYATGAVETAVLEEADKDIIIIEGQGSLLNPSSTATLPLMRGSCPTHLLLCMRGDKTTLRSNSEIKIPNLREFIALNESLATVCGTYPAAKVIGCAVNTSMLSESDATAVLERIAAESGVPAADPVRNGVEVFVRALVR